MHNYISRFSVYHPTLDQLWKINEFGILSNKIQGVDWLYSYRGAAAPPPPEKIGGNAHNPGNQFDMFFSKKSSTHDNGPDADSYRHWNIPNEGTENFIEDKGKNVSIIV